MKPVPAISLGPDAQPSELMPLLSSIGRELSERLDAIRRLEQYFRRVGLTPENAWLHRAELAEAATNYRALDQVRNELSSLASSIVGTDP